MIQMNILNDEEIRLKFLMNLPVRIDGIGEFYAPSLLEIVDMTEVLYNSSLSTIFLDKKKLENQEDIEQYTDFEVVLTSAYFDSSFRELFFNCFNLHFHKEPQLHEEEFIYFDYPSEETILTEEKFNYIKNLITIANHIAPPKEEEYNAANERARKMIEKMKKKNAEAAKYKKKTIDLHSIISAVGWKAKGFDFIRELNIYQLYDGYGRLGIIDNYHYTMTGIYAGTVDTKGIKLPELNWANIIQQK